MNANRSSRAAANRKKRRRRQAGQLFLAAAVVLIVWGAYGIWSQVHSSRAPESESTLRPIPSASSPLTASMPPAAAASPSASAAAVQTPAASGTNPPSPAAASPQESATAAPAGEATPSSSATAGSGGGSGGSSGSGGSAALLPYEPGLFADPARVQMSFVGDVLLGSTVEGLLNRNGYDYPYRNVLSYLQRPDLTVADLETPITNGGGSKQTKEYVYYSSPETLPAFKEAGFDLVNLANNHVMDYGAEGLLETFRHLNDNGIPYIGAGKNAEEAFKPVIIEKKGVKIAFLGFSRVVPDHSWKAGPDHAGVADAYNYTLPVEAIKKAKARADLVVVFAHWGVERQDTPESYQRDLAHRFIDAGADLIVASHPHVLQGFETYKGKWIAYSLGNFIFTTNDVVKTWDSMILEASCSKEGECAVNAVPVLTKAAQPAVMLPDAALALFRRLSQLSYGARILDNGNIVPVRSGE